jgi:hypothetical protein
MFGSFRVDVATLGESLKHKGAVLYLPMAADVVNPA